MCGRMEPLTLRQVMSVLQGLAADAASGVTLDPEWRERLRDVFPGSAVQLMLPLTVLGAETDGPAVEIPGVTSPIAPAQLDWGFSSPSNPKQRVFNTRIETAARDVERGWGLWKEPLENGRCVVPCRSFFEPSRDEKVLSPRTGREIKRQYEFRTAGEDVTLLAAVAQGGRFSVVTTEPNRDMEDIHPRMPLVLEPEEVAVWLGSDYMELRDRSSVRLESRPDDPAPAGQLKLL
ncbi:SOS response-associated peptidase family protein [Olsenella sp. YH-ols2217]|uniref:Abasic site processing protein n=1 Tax=Kribbibacterium absianum TaxID=3044210 RepID=A0ABT6ZML6_9ACTN|nr:MULTISPECIES: SOS response-associated peptidase family protein [unclassified Olsenella]MDJ1122295.1 SOS response-associated peptidase family protein [Olsenella sp. YH-ols2216]MDJ1130291.1 SOS response-associated peptidase family protein [Olsenella sp. YH-ols2217]